MGNIYVKLQKTASQLKQGIYSIWLQEAVKNDLRDHQCGEYHCTGGYQGGGACMFKTNQEVINCLAQA